MQQTTAPETILVVEDEPFIRMSAVSILEDAGFWVLEAQNSTDALDILARHPEVTIMLTDVRMPGGIDGLALVAQVQVNHPAVRSIVTSGNASPQDAIDVGAMAFIAKPYLGDTMLKAVRDTVLRH